ncbi:MAG: translation initiation factor IF-2 [Kiritimatiellae bacterium]|nr:translation initiation factor IF-2 [Kiritimatiellia bacterium]
MRMFELARELGLPSKELIHRLRELGEDVSDNPASNASVTQVRKARELWGPKAAEAPPAAETAAAPSAVGEATVAPPPPSEPPPAPPPAAVSQAAEAPATPPPTAPAPPSAPTPKPSVVRIREPITVRALAEMMQVRPNQLVAELMKMNIFKKINDPLDFRTALQVGQRLGIRVEQEKRAPVEGPKPPKKAIERPAEPPPPSSSELQPRPPVVTFMGHVDHGKTSLLDYIRKTRIAAGEAGGITQHIGAYMVQVRDRWITFIDTPGHAAFTQMRARGANVTDIAVIVIAADEGVKPQTLEAIQHARAANVTIMCAINKIDLPGANVDRVKAQLQQNGLTPDDWGGKIVCVPVSAVTGQGIPDLLEMILLQADLLELKAPPHRPAKGFVLEAKLAPGSGPVATVLIKSGTLKVGDAVVCGEAWGRVRSLENDRGIRQRTAGPGFAVQMLGLNAVPPAGAEFEVVESDRAAREIAEARIEASRRAKLQTPTRTLSLDDLLTKTDPTQKVELSIVLKCDVQGTLEAVQQALSEIKSTRVSLKIVLAGVGNVSANDVLLAKASNAIVIGFHVGGEPGVEKIAKREGVEIRLYSVIYELVEEVRNAMAGLLQPIVREVPLGQALVKQVFQLSRKGNVAGCLVRSGRVLLRGRARVRRGGDIVYEGSIASLRRFQNDATEVREGQECGIRLDNFNAFEPGDIIEVYEVQKIAQTL